jgi:hypothetical protein
MEHRNLGDWGSRVQISALRPTILQIILKLRGARGGGRNAANAELRRNTFGRDVCMFHRIVYYARGGIVCRATA